MKKQRNNSWKRLTTLIFSPQFITLAMTSKRYQIGPTEVILRISKLSSKISCHRCCYCCGLWIPEKKTFLLSLYTHLTPGVLKMRQTLSPPSQTGPPGDELSQINLNFINKKSLALRTEKKASPRESALAFVSRFLRATCQGKIARARDCFRFRAFPRELLFSGSWQIELSDADFFLRGVGNRKKTYKAIANFTVCFIPKKIML